MRSSTLLFLDRYLYHLFVKDPLWLVVLTRTPAFSHSPLLPKTRLWVSLARGKTFLTRLTEYFLSTVSVRFPIPSNVRRTILFTRRPWSYPVSCSSPHCPTLNDYLTRTSTGSFSLLVVTEVSRLELVNPPLYMFLFILVSDSLSKPPFLSH